MYCIKNLFMKIYIFMKIINLIFWHALWNPSTKFKCLVTWARVNINTDLLLFSDAIICLNTATFTLNSEKSEGACFHLLLLKSLNRMPSLRDHF